MRCLNRALDALDGGVVSLFYVVLNNYWTLKVPIVDGVTVQNNVLFLSLSIDLLFMSTCYMKFIWQISDPWC